MRASHVPHWIYTYIKYVNKHIPAKFPRFGKNWQVDMHTHTYLSNGANASWAGGVDEQTMSQREGRRIGRGRTACKTDVPHGCAGRTCGTDMLDEHAVRACWTRPRSEKDEGDERRDRGGARGIPPKPRLSKNAKG